MKTKTKANIIIAVISILIVFFGVNAIAQIDSSAHCITANDVSNVVDSGVSILNATHNTIIPNVDNSIVGSVITALALLVIRIIEKRKLRKNGKLKDEKNNSIYHE